MIVEKIPLHVSNSFGYPTGGYYMSIIGIGRDNKKQDISNVFCVRRAGKFSKMRKNPIDVQNMWKNDDCFAMVSHPGLHKSYFVNRAKFWCHPFRDINTMIPNLKTPSILLSESDFVEVKDYNKKKKYDFFCFVPNKLCERKGTATLLNLLPYLCKRYIGIVIFYVPQKKGFLWELSKQHKKNIDSCGNNLRVRWGWQLDKDALQLMSSCKFGFFPSEVDCSPRTITECLCQNVPIMVNKKIWGGWKYVNEETGVEFDPYDKHDFIDTMNKLDIIINKCKEGKISPRNNFLSKYGMWNSGKILAGIFNKTFDTDYELVFFINHKVNSKIKSMIQKGIIL